MPRGHLSNDEGSLAAKVTEFWGLVRRGGFDDCWPWEGYIAPSGYGEFFIGDGMMGAHELAVTFSSGETRAPALDTCHSCNNPPCCNPAHLRFDTRQGNVDDMVSADRHARGARNGHSKLTERDVEIMRNRAVHGATGARLAADYGVSQALVTEILRGRRWAHAPGPLRTVHGNTQHGKYAHL